MMVRRSIKKPKLRKKQKQSEKRLSSVLLQESAGIAIGTISAFLFLAMAALIMKLSSAGIAECAGWVLAVKILAALTAAIAAIRGGGRKLWLWGAIAGLVCLLAADLILACFTTLHWMPMLADLGLGAVLGFAAGCLFSILKK